MTKTFRYFLQSAMLGLGAYVVLQGEMSAGAMIAGSILLGRALAPVEQAIGGWPLVLRARQGWTNLKTLLASDAGAGGADRPAPPARAPRGQPAHRGAARAAEGEPAAARLPRSSRARRSG